MRSLQQAIDERSTELREQRCERLALEEEQARKLKQYRLEIVCAAKKFFGELYDADLGDVRLEVTEWSGRMNILIHIQDGVARLKPPVELDSHGGLIISNIGHKRIWRAQLHPDGECCDFENLLDALMFAMGTDWST